MNTKTETVKERGDIATRYSKTNPAKIRYFWMHLGGGSITIGTVPNQKTYVAGDVFTTNCDLHKRTSYAKSKYLRLTKKEFKIALQERLEAERQRVQDLQDIADGIEPLPEEDEAKKQQEKFADDNEPDEELDELTSPVDFIDPKFAEDNEDDEELESQLAELEDAFEDDEDEEVPKKKNPNKCFSGKKSKSKRSDDDED